MISSHLLAASAGLLIVLIGLSGSAVTAADIDAAIGDRVSLTGTAIGTDTMYLYVTGPGLAPNGVRLDNMRSAVITGDPSTFTVTDVRNDHWAYSWNTARQGFTLKEGIYTVYATKQPAGKEDLRGTHGTIDVSLTYGGEPYQSTGTVYVDATPQALISVNGQVRGVTPQNLTLPIGSYSIRLERDGYATVIESVTVTGGSVTEVRKTLMPIMVPSVSGTTIPASTVTITTGATETVASPHQSPPPTRTPGVLGGILAALICAAVVRRSRRA